MHATSALRATVALQPKQLPDHTHRVTVDHRTQLPSPHAHACAAIWTTFRRRQIRGLLCLLRRDLTTTMPPVAGSPAPAALLLFRRASRLERNLRRRRRGSERTLPRRTFLTPNPVLEPLVVGLQVIDSALFVQTSATIRAIYAPPARVSVLLSCRMRC